MFDLNYSIYHYKMYVIHALDIMQMCFKTTKQLESQMWHIKYAHMSIKGLAIFVKKEMVKGLLSLVNTKEKSPYFLVGK